MVRGVAWKIWVGVWMGLAIVAGFLWVKPAVGGFVLGGQAAKIVFFHVPCAWLASAALIVAGVYAVKHLTGVRGSNVALENDFKCAAAMELGFLFAVLATVTGSIFAKLQWGQYWVWNEPRMLSILIVLLIFAAYLVLRGSVEDQDKRGRLSAVYTLVSVVPLIFLLWILPRIVPSLHEGPNETFVKGQISSGFKIAMYGLSLPAYVGLFVWMFQLRLRTLKLFSNRERRLMAAAS